MSSASVRHSCFVASSREQRRAELEFERALQRNESHDGYDLDGFDADGFDRDGFDRHGFNHEGINRRGFAKWRIKGWGQGEPDEYELARFHYQEARENYGVVDGFDLEGYDSEGFDRDGVNRFNLNRRGALITPKVDEDSFF